MSMTQINTIVDLTDDTPLLQDVPALQEKAEREGVLFFKRLVDKQAVLNLRDEILKVAKKYDWLLEDEDPLAGRVDVTQAVEGGVGPNFGELYAELQTLRAVHAFAVRDEIMKVFAKLFGESVLAHPRNIIRTIYPNTSKWTTPAHQDFVQIAGTQNTWTAWVPLGDCARSEMGGLAVVPGTHRKGILPMSAADGAGGVSVQVPDDATWLGTDYEVGDVIIFHSLLVHQGINNQTQDRMRISTDMRYQPASEPVHPSSLLPHTCEENWDRIYAHWPDENDPVKHYWKSMPLTIVDNMPEKPTS